MLENNQMGPYAIRIRIIMRDFGWHSLRTRHHIEILTAGWWGPAGTLVGFIEKESNLQGNSVVLGNAQVYGNAIVYGDAIVEKTPICISGLRHHITITETHIFIGCEGHPISHWKKEVRNIGLKNDYSESEIQQHIDLFKSLIRK